MGWFVSWWIFEGLYIRWCLPLCLLYASLGWVGLNFDPLVLGRSGVTRKGEELACAVCVKATVSPDGRQNIYFSLTWDMPIIHFGAKGNKYHRSVFIQLICILSQKSVCYWESGFLSQLFFIPPDAMPGILVTMGMPLHVWLLMHSINCLPGRRRLKPGRNQSCPAGLAALSHGIRSFLKFISVWRGKKLQNGEDLVFIRS